MVSLIKVFFVFIFLLISSGCLSGGPQVPPSSTSTSVSPPLTSTTIISIEDCFVESSPLSSTGPQQFLMFCLVKKGVKADRCYGFVEDEELIEQINEGIMEHFPDSRLPPVNETKILLSSMCESFSLMRKVLERCDPADIERLLEFETQATGFSIKSGPDGVESIFSTEENCLRMKERDRTLCETFKKADDKRACIAAAEQDPGICEANRDCLMGLAIITRDPEACSLMKDAEIKSTCYFLIDFFVDEDVCARLDPKTEISVCEMSSESTVISQPSPTPTTQGFISLKPEVDYLKYGDDGELRVTFRNGVGRSITIQDASMEINGLACEGEISFKPENSIEPSSGFILSFQDCPTTLDLGPPAYTAKISITYKSPRLGEILFTEEGWINVIVEKDVTIRTMQMKKN
ncbi:MAG: hypothetical protein ABH950_09170 [Candidatus Altiarchaeota archaeon]